MSMRSVLSTVCVALLAALSVSCGSSSATGIIYLVGQSDQTVGAYKINLTSGVLNTSNNALAPIGKLAKTGVQPRNLIFDPSGKFGYIVEYGNPAGGPANTDRSGDVAEYTVNMDGSLATAGSVSRALPCQTYSPVSIATDSAGHFAFVASQVFYNVDPSATTCSNPPSQNNTPAPGALTVFAIDNQGKLIQQDEAIIPAPAGAPASSIPTPTAVGVSNQGNFVYVSDTVNSSIVAYSYDTTSGKLTVLPFSTTTTPIPVDQNPSAIFSPPTGNFLYVTSSGANVIDGFKINTDGSLVKVIGSPQSTGIGPMQMLGDANGKYLLTVDNKSNQISGFRINQVTGALTGFTPAPAASTGNGPVAATIRSNGVVNGDYWIVVSDYGANAVSTIKLTTSTGNLAALPQLISPVAPYGIASR